MRETSELPLTSLPHPTTSLLHRPRHSHTPSTSLPHPTTSFPRRRESIPPCIAFDKTELPYYPRHMDTPRNRSPRRHRAIPNSQSAIFNPPNSPSTESDRMQHNPTRCYSVLRKLVPARTRARRPPSRRADTREASPPVTPVPTSFPHSPTSFPHSPTSFPHPPTSFPRRRESIPGIDRIRPIARSRRLISLTPIHQNEPI